MKKSKEAICSRCWFKEQGKCNKICKYSRFKDNPIEIAHDYLSEINDVRLFPFLCQYVIPIYEKTTGNTGIMEKICKMFKKRLKKEHPDVFLPA